LPTAIINFLRFSLLIILFSFDSIKHSVDNPSYIRWLLVSTSVLKQRKTVG